MAGKACMVMALIMMACVFQACNATDVDGNNLDQKLDCFKSCSIDCGKQNKPCYDECLTKCGLPKRDHAKPSPSTAV